jgi:hypothetical protein
MKTIRLSFAFAFLLAAFLPRANGTATPLGEISVYADSLTAGWQDWSWSVTTNYTNTSPVHAGSASLAVSFTTGWDGFWLQMPGALDLGDRTALRFWIHGGNAGGQSVTVTIDRGSKQCATAVRAVTAQGGSWTMVEIPLGGVDGTENTKIQFFNNTDHAQPTFYLDDIRFVTPSITAPVSTGPDLTVDVQAGRAAINPLIYGMNFADEDLAAELRLPVNRWGGNATTRYNWQNDTSNHAVDWYFENIPNDNPHPETLPNGSSSDRFVEQNLRTGTQTLLTVPLIGFTPKSRGYACGFSVAKYGAQDDVDPWRTDCGNGIQNGVQITANSSSDTSLGITPQFNADWIAHLQVRYGSAAAGGVTLYNLDNEPMLWNSTHRDVHPQPTSYDELRDRTYAYAAAVKAADPASKTLGPALWGWVAYFYSALDVAAGGSWWDTRPDRKAHGDIPFLPWYLQQMKAYETTHGLRLLDYADIHFYPQADHVFSDQADPATAELRLRATRSLWDPTYTDESWINDTIDLIPRLRAWVTENYSGTRTALSEYSFGSMCSVNGALAQADALGIFGREQLDLAALWGAPTAAQPGAYAFRLFRNYDGLGRAFGETEVSAVSAASDQLSVYAAQRTVDGALTMIVVNKTSNNLTSTVHIQNFNGAPSAVVYRYSAAKLNGIQILPSQNIGAGTTSATFAANSITLWVLPVGGERFYLPAVSH